MRVGILGGGQLGRMLGLAGIPLGHEFIFLSPQEECPAAAVGTVVRGELDDQRALEQFARLCDVVTFEFENVPAHSLEWLAARVPVAPGTASLSSSQDRVVEKSFFSRNEIPVQAYRAVHSQDELAAACGTIGFPGVLKTRRLGYDGKGQAVVKLPTDAPAAWKALGGAPCIYEQFVPFQREVSAIAVRGSDGSTAMYPLCENVHRHGILRATTVPACGVDAALERTIAACMERAMDSLGHVGVLTIEFFVGPEGVVANEMAPRVHNSGHWTQDGAMTSQFENHVRAITGAPLGGTQARGCCGMVNLIGGVPDTNELLAVPGARVHLYGKQPRAGRKLGHVNVCAPDAAVRDAQLRVLSGLVQASEQG